MVDEKKDDLLKGANAENVENILEEINANPKEDAASDSRRNTGSKRRGMLVISFLLLLFIASTVYSITRVNSLNAPLKVSDEEKITVLKDYLYLVNTRIEKFRFKNSRLPLSKEEAFIEDSSITYTKVNDSTYSIMCEYGDVSYTYRSNEDAEELLSPRMLEQLSKREVTNE